MTVIADRLPPDQLSGLARLQARLVTSPPPPAGAAAGAVCPECGQPLPPPAAVFREPR